MHVTLFLISGGFAHPDILLLHTIYGMLPEYWIALVDLLRYYAASKLMFSCCVSQVGGHWCGRGGGGADTLVTATITKPGTQYEENF